MSIRHWLRSLAIMAVVVSAQGVRAETAADFFHGKTVTIYVGFGPGYALPPEIVHRAAEISAAGQ